MYVDRPQYMKKTLRAVCNPLTESQKLRTLLRGLNERFKTTGEIGRITEKNLHSAIAQLIIKEADVQDSLKSMKAKTEPNHALTAGSLNGDCEHCGRARHNKDGSVHNPRVQNTEEEANRGNKIA